MCPKQACVGFPGGRRALFLILASAAVPAHAGEPQTGKVVYEIAGYVVPIQVVSVTPKVGGQVVELNVEEGKVVRKGEVLARLEAAEYKTKLDAATAGLELASARLDKVKAAAASGDKDVAIARAEVARARAEVEKAQWQLDATTVRAPVTGTILRKMAEVGNIMSPLAFNAPASICEIADLHELEVDLSVPERDVGRVARGQACLVRLDAFPKTTYRGQVSRVMPVADRAKGAIPVRVKIEVPAKDTQLRPEMRAVVSILGKEG
jgi:RND family efflux transporter MFP subunit